MTKNHTIEIPEFKFAVRSDLTLSSSYMPAQGSERATGWDVKVAFHGKDSLEIFPNQAVKIPLGIRALIPDGWWLELRPRSSTFGKKHLSALYGVIDEDYEGELIFACQWNPPPDCAASLTLTNGEAIGQLIPVKRQQMIVTSLSNDEIDREFAARGLKRGTGGFGSTG